MGKKMKIKDFLKSAAKAFAGATLNIQKFANCYVNARLAFADDERTVIDSFKAAYPMFGQREWNRFWLVGNHILLPQFMFKSDSFVGKLLKMKDHMKWQHALVSASEDGKLLVDRGKGPEKVTLSELTKKEERTLALLLNEKDSELSPTMLVEKFSSIVRQVNKSRPGNPAWEIELADESKPPSLIADIEYVNGEAPLVRIRRGKYGKRELQQILKALKLNWADKCTTTKSATEMMKEMALEIVKLNGLRDEEWEMEDEPRDAWNENKMRHHEKLLEDIFKSRKRLTKMVQEVTGDESLTV